MFFKRDVASNTKENWISVKKKINIKIIINTKIN